MQGRRRRRRKWTLLLRIALMPMLGLLLLSLTTFRPPPPLKYPVYFLGDSITAGRSATLPHYTYRERLIADLRHDTHDEVTESGGWGSGWRVIDGLLAASTAPPSANTPLIVVELGTNDASEELTGRSPTDPATFDLEYAQLIARLQQAAPRATFVCLSAWLPEPDALAYNATIARYCPGGHYADITAMFSISTFHGPAGLPEDWYFANWTTDTFHPNNTAMAAIARLIETWLGLRDDQAWGLQIG